MTKMHLSILEQYHHEHLTWERILEFFRQENAFLKMRLSEVLDQTTDNAFLMLAEQFQNQFIIKDEFMDDLKKDIHDMELQLKNEVTNLSHLSDKKMEIRHNKLRNEMEYLEKDFTQLRNDFNKYLVSIL